MKSKQELIEKWESAIEAAEFYGKGKEERLIEYMKDFVSDLNQLDEPEVLSDKWIDDNSVYASSDGVTEEYVHVDDLQNLLVPKQEEVVEGRVRLVVGFDGGTDSYYATDVEDALDFLTDYDARFTVNKEPVIPKFVADWIKHNEEIDLSDTIHFTIYGLYADWPDTNTMVELRKLVLKWLGEDRNNYFKLIDAARYGYEVAEEREQKYVISINITDKASKTNYETFLNKRGIFHSMDNDSFNSEEFNWTEEEIKDLESGEILFEHFAVKVEELE